MSAQTEEEYLVLFTGTELVRVPLSALVCVVADGNYSSIRTADGNEQVLTMQLGQIETSIGDAVRPGDKRFVRTGKSLIVNRDYISFINITRQKLVLSDSRSFRHELSASREALRLLKDLIVKEEVK